jgi:hypothetical protein
VERKIQAGIAQGQFDTKRLKYAGVDLLAASRGQGGKCYRRSAHLSLLPEVTNV